MKFLKLGVAIISVIVIILMILILTHKKSAPAKSTTKTPPTTQQHLTANGQAVPTQFTEKAKSLGYYCPSWNAKPGEIAPAVCYKLDN